MSYPYTPGTRPDALAILRDKGLLDTPVRPRHTPGVFLLDLHDHCRVGADGLPHKVVEADPVPPMVWAVAEVNRWSVSVSQLVLFGLVPVVIWMVLR